MACCLAFDLDPYENLHLFLEEMDHFEIDELLIIAVPLAIGIMIDLIHARNLKRQQVLKVEQHLETLGSTLHTAQDIINNFLNSIQLYILKAHDQKLDAEDVERLDDLIMNTTQRLSDLEQPILEADEEKRHLNHADEINL
tara:strand:+ start:32367 stop:32789 length:423 start_codon:yes stop_codon:yes gene_type:complete